jgi:cytochrome c-type biogenesis protein CcmH/NrfG
VAARLTVLTLAVFLAGFGLVAHHDWNRCNDEGRLVFRVGAGQQKHVTDTEVDQLAGACRGSHILALAANVMAVHRQPRAAIRLADEAIRREPRNFEGWVALSRALRDRHLDTAAARALRRALALNPRFARSPD